MRNNIYTHLFPLGFLLLALTFSFDTQAQKATSASKKENALLWEISGKQLTQPSYLFGTFHLLTSEFIDSLPVVKEKLNAAQVVIGEVVIDSTQTAKFSKAMMADSSLNQLLKPEEYQQLATYWKQQSGSDLNAFNNLKPMAVQFLLIQFEMAKLNPDKPGQGKSQGMDIYFQKLATAAGKPIVGLEMLEEQINLLFGTSLKSQAEGLMQAVKEKKNVNVLLAKMVTYYRQQNLQSLKKLFYENDRYQPEVIAQLLDNRNQKWMEKLPALIQDKPSFIAVGAGHLVGEKGLIKLLRKQGYTVKPMAIHASAK